jgi:hypothetical protein
VVVVAAASCFGVEPEAWGTEKRAAACSPSTRVSKQLFQEVGTLPFETLPGILPIGVEHPVERRRRYNTAASAAAVARLDDRESLGRWAHEALESIHDSLLEKS